MLTSLAMMPLDSFITKLVSNEDTREILASVVEPPKAIGRKENINQVFAKASKNSEELKELGLFRAYSDYKDYKEAPLDGIIYRHLHLDLAYSALRLTSFIDSVISLIQDGDSELMDVMEFNDTEFDNIEFGTEEGYEFKKGSSGEHTWYHMKAGAVNLNTYTINANDVVGDDNYGNYWKADSKIYVVDLRRDDPPCPEQFRLAIGLDNQNKIGIWLSEDQYHVNNNLLARQNTDDQYDMAISNLLNLRKNDFLV